MADAMDSQPGARPRFGDAYLNTQAGESNPRRIGMFVQVVRRSGRLNPGVWWQMTDGNGDFWLSNPAHLAPVSANLLGIDPVGAAEIAQRLGVQPATVWRWKQRGLLPPPRWTVSGAPCWDWSVDLEPWAKRTGRMSS